MLLAMLRSVRLLRASRVPGVRAQQLQEQRHVPPTTDRTRYDNAVLLYLFSLQEQKH